MESSADTLFFHILSDVWAFFFKSTLPFHFVLYFTHAPASWGGGKKTNIALSTLSVFYFKALHSQTDTDYKGSAIESLYV